MPSQREFHLLHDSILSTADAHAAGRLRGGPLIVPDGVSSLRRDTAGDWQLTAMDGNELGEEHCLLEPLWQEQRPQLLLVSRYAGRVRVNGPLVPQLYLLSERDQLQLDDGSLFHVTLYHHTVVGSPSAERIGSGCPVCRTAIAASERVYTCQQCGTAIHLQGDETPPETRLECALTVSTCPACQQKIDVTAGYTWQPELYCE